MGMYHSASELRQTGDLRSVDCFILCYEVTGILWMGFYFLVLLRLYERYM